MDITKRDYKYGISIGLSLKKPNFYLLILLLSIICIFTFKDYLFLNKLYIFLDIGGDTYTYFFPYFVNISDYIRNEGIPAWSFFHGMGQNIFPGEINNPFALILYFLGREYIPFGLIYVEVLKIVLGGVFFYSYLKTLSLSDYVCITGGILFAFSGYMILGSGWYGHSTFIVFAIFFLFSFEKMFKENIWYYFPLSVALIVSRSPFYLYILGVFIFIYSIFRISNEEGWDIKKTCFFYLKITGLGVLGLAMVTPFLANDLLRMLESPRVGGDAGYFNELMAAPVFSFGDYEHNVTAVLRLFSNDILGVGSNFNGWYNYLEAPNLYCGLITLLLFPQLFFFINKKKKIIFYSFLFFWTLFIIFPFLRYGLYLFTGDYYKGGISFFIPFILLFYSLHAFDAILKEKAVNRKLLICTLMVLLGILYFPYTLHDQNLVIINETRIVITSLLIIYALIFYFYGKVISTRMLRFCLLLVICIEAYMFSFITANSRIALTAQDLLQTVGYNDETVNILSAIKTRDKGFYRIDKDYFSGIAAHSSLNDSLIQGYYGTPSYNQWNQKYYIRFLAETGIIEGSDDIMTRWAPGLSSRPLLETISSVKYFLSRKEYFNFRQFSYEKYYRYGNVLALKNKYFLPLGFTYNKYITYSDFKKLDTFQKHVIFLKAFVVEDNSVDLGYFELFDINSLKKTYSYKEYEDDVNKLRHETMNINYHSQNKIEGDIKVEGKKLMFFSIPFDGGWKIKVDGQKVKPELINIGFIGVVLQKGFHKIELHYVPPFLMGGTAVMIISIFLYTVFILKSVFKVKQ